MILINKATTCMTRQLLAKSESGWEKGGNSLCLHLIMTRVRVWIRIHLLPIEWQQV